MCCIKCGGKILINPERYETISDHPVQMWDAERLPKIKGYKSICSRCKLTTNKIYKTKDKAISSISPDTDCKINLRNLSKEPIVHICSQRL
jgi:hypothetical protein